MKEGTVFEHFTGDGRVVRLRAIKEIDSNNCCEGCYFESLDGRCMDEGAYDCATSNVIFIETDPSNKTERIMRVVRDNTESYGEEQDKELELLIRKIVEE